MIKKKRILFFVLFLCLTATVLISDTTEDSELQMKDILKMSLEDLTNLEVTSATKLSQKMNEAPGIISMITRDQIDNYGWLSLDDIITRQPGFFPSMDYERHTIGSRGLFEGWNNNHLLLLIDGVPFNDNLYGSAYTWEITPLFLTQSVEISRGPGSALYGSNAMNGVINIHTVNASDLTHSGMVRIQAGNFNSQIFDWLYGRENHALSFVLGFNASHTSGNQYQSYDSSGRRDSNGALQRFPIKDAHSSRYFFGKIQGEDLLSGMSLQLHYQDWNFQTGHGWLWMIPDQNESMNESRLMISFAYKQVYSKKVSWELAARYQRHDLDWNIKYYPDGAFDDFYPAGSWEYLKSDAEDLFFQTQVSVSSPKDCRLMIGLEGTLFLYNGDDEHYSNTDINDSGGFFMDDGTWVFPGQGLFAPFSGNIRRPLGPWFEWIKGNPVLNTGLYAQFVSGNVLGKKLKATFGVRFDNQTFHFNPLDNPEKKEEGKHFSSISPRVGLVYLPSSRLSVKFLFGRAFRAPSPTEMFGANTWTLASNIREVKPEYITTFETAMDWLINKNVNWRLNLFHTRLQNQISYSEQNNNLSTNIFTLTTAGLETELLFAVHRFSGFLNYSYAKRLNEKIIDNTITESSNFLTWAPAHTINAGLTYSGKRLKCSIQAHYQGKVYRRESDFKDPDLIRFRPESVSDWVSLDAKITYQFSQSIELICSGSNLLDSRNDIIKNFSYPFDYRLMGRRFMLGFCTRL